MSSIIDWVAAWPGYVQLVVFGGLGVAALWQLDRYLLRPVEWKLDRRSDGIESPLWRDER